MIMKKVYTKPEMKVYQLQHQSPLLQASVLEYKINKNSYNSYNVDDIEDL